MSRPLYCKCGARRDANGDCRTAGGLGCTDVRERNAAAKAQRAKRAREASEEAKPLGVAPGRISAPRSPFGLLGGLGIPR